MPIVSPRFAHLIPVILLLFGLMQITGCSLRTAGGEDKQPEIEPMAEPEPPVPAQSQPLRLRPNYPEHYTVVKGDTLWDISSRFLKDPWMWPELWQVNPQVSNPHLIYPGDVLTMYFIDGKPVLRVERPGEAAPPMPQPSVQQPVPAPKQPAAQPMPGGGFPVVKYRPTIRELPLEEAVPAIPLDKIKQYLSRPRVITEGELEEMPYVVSYVDARLMGSAGDTFYVRGLKEDDVAQDYILMRAGQPYEDPDSGDFLGYEAVFLGEAKFRTYGDPSTFILTKAHQEVFRGDRLAPLTNDTLRYHFIPRAPEKKLKGRIIASLGGGKSIGQFQVVVLNLGRQEDIDAGHVLAVMQHGAEVEDVIEGESIDLPDIQAGTLMVFRVFERVSYALVLEATRPIFTEDVVINP